MPLTLSILVSAHNEGMLLHSTLNSILKALVGSNIDYEILIGLDTPNSETEKVVNSLIDQDKIDKYFKLTFKDVSSVRNFLANKAKYNRCLIWDGDDLMGANFFKYLKEFNKKEIYYPEFEVYFDKNNLLVARTAKVDRAGVLLSNPFTAQIIIEKQAITEIGFTETKDSQAFEDWDFNLKLLANNYKFKAIKKAVSFIHLRNNSRNDNAMTNSLKLPQNELIDSREKFNSLIKDSWLNRTILTKSALIYNNKFIIKAFIGVQKIRQFTLKPLFNYFLLHSQIKLIKNEYDFKMQFSFKNFLLAKKSYYDRSYPLLLLYLIVNKGLSINDSIVNTNKFDLSILKQRLENIDGKK